MVVVVEASFLNLPVLAKSMRPRPYKMLLHKAVLLVQVVPVRSDLLKEILVLVGIEEGQGYVNPREHDNIDALVEELLLGIGLGDCNSCSEYGCTRVDKTDKREDVEDTEVVHAIQPRRKHLESEQLAEDDIAELMIGHNCNHTNKPVETFMAARFASPSYKLLLITQEDRLSYAGCYVHHIQESKRAQSDVSCDRLAHILDVVKIQEIYQCAPLQKSD